MHLIRIMACCLAVLVSPYVVAAEEPKVGTWIFSGLATNDSGERFGYFFQMQRQGNTFHAKTALIDGQTNTLLFFYEDKALLEDVSSLNWHVGHAFMHYNPIDASWIFGVKEANNKGFNFKVDVAKKESNSNEKQMLQPGIQLQVVETTRLNGHMQAGQDKKEQFVTGNKAWFATLEFSTHNNKTGAVNTTFCRLQDNNGFYAANIQEAHAAKPGVSGWYDATGTKLKMSPNISMKSLANNERLLQLGLPKLTMKLLNTLSNQTNTNEAVAGFSKQIPLGFCFAEQQPIVPVA